MPSRTPPTRCPRVLYSLLTVALPTLSPALALTLTPTRCGVLVELLAYALIVGILAGLVYCTRPHFTFVAQEAGDYPVYPVGVGAPRGLVEPGDGYVESVGAH